MQIESPLLGAQAPFGFRSVAVAGKANGRAFVCGPGRWCARSSRSQELRQQRVRIAQGFIAYDHGDFAVARGRGKGNQAAFLQEAGDAICGTLHHELHIVLRGRGRGMKHRWGISVVGITHINAIENQRVEMRIEAATAGTPVAKPASRLARV